MKTTRSPKTAACLLLICLAGAVCAAPAARPPWTAEYEKKVGEQAMAELERSYSRVDNPDALAKLQSMIDVIASKSPRPDVKYTVAIVREKEPGPEPEVNAFALPGGFVFVTEGLLNEVQSDHELAAVLAHEVTHNAHYDGLTLARKASNIFKGELAAVAAAILLAGIENDAWLMVMQAGVLYRHSILGGYSMDMERRADLGAISILAQTEWDPVGMLTFMERLAAKERRQPPMELGVFQDHPITVDRVRYLIEALLEMGVDINRRRTANWIKPLVEERQVNGKTAQAVVWHGHLVFACDAPGPDGTDPKARAESVAQTLTAVLADGAQLYSFRTGTHDGKAALFGSDQVVFVVEDVDAALFGKSGDEVVKDAFQAIRAGLAKEHLGRLY